MVGMVILIYCIGVVSNAVCWLLPKFSYQNINPPCLSYSTWPSGILIYNECDKQSAFQKKRSMFVRVCAPQMLSWWTRPILNYFAHEIVLNPFRNKMYSYQFWQKLRSHESTAISVELESRKCNILNSVEPVYTRCNDVEFPSNDR